MKKLCIALMISSVLLCSCGAKTNDTINDISNSVLEQDTTTVNDEETSETMLASAPLETEITESSPIDPTDQTDITTEFDQDAYNKAIRAQIDADMEEFVKLYEDMNVITDEPYESAITTTTSDDILDEYLFWLMRIQQSHARNIWKIYDTYGMECLRKAGYTEHGNWRMYSIHKLESGAMFYLFYEDCFLRNTVLMTKSLTKADFSEIKIGDTVEDVAEIEPAAACWKNIRVRNKELYPDRYTEENGFTIPLLLKDGLLIIIYEFRDNDYYIEDIVFHDDFKAVYPDFKYNLTAEEDVYYYSILPEDYPGETS